jgi:phosphoribosylformylglycinamidine cyclo-ligase
VTDRYAAAGVRLDVAEDAKRRIGELARGTRTPLALGGIGAFGGMVRVPPGFEKPVLVLSTDGVGTKVLVAARAGIHDTVGEDLVNHCVNDILVQGARPLFFLDYIAMARMRPPAVQQIITGLAKACRANGCALIGGETAEMPGVYAEGEIDIAGTIVGAVSREHLLDGSRVQPGDKLLGLASSGLHTNGYSLARRILFQELALPLDARPDELRGSSVREAVLAVHRSYLACCLPLVHAGLLVAMAHITGGGLPDNVPRVLPKGTAARIERAAIPPQPLCEFLVARGKVDREEAYRVLNMGVGMVLFVRPAALEVVMQRLRASGEECFPLGEVIAGDQLVHMS